ncbi:glycosyltransferase family 4 protein [Vibrio parahaemolyticus]|uniref:glycosyltransferase family 4 protein n=1 Tax=Vibrio parahaemolyticus TaxID=670 RepID=UPI0027E4D177|nr:glycosyltransferase family 4 protein [Vibrio parahaemolyticus]WMN68084.1 glycosyltransferase family 4 protein [Vibrio parahaemolyticus]
MSLNQKINTKIKMMVITPRFPYPVIGGDRLRIFELCRELSKKYSITLVSLCESESDMKLSLPQDGVFDEVHRVLLPKWKSYFNCVKAIPTQKPLQVAYYECTEFSSLINKLAPEFDIVLAHLVRVADYAKDLNCIKILEMTDAISMNYRRFIDNKNSTGLKGLIYKFEYKRLNRYEKSITEQFDLSVLVSEHDKDFLFSNSKLSDKVLVCSNGVDLSKLPYEFSPSSKEIIFIGNMFSSQNFDAAYWFASQVMPILIQRGDFKFKVIGRIRDDAKARLLKLDNVIVTGAVDDIVGHARGALVGVCPVRLAAGVQNKILEYMALGIPSITSSIGLEGLFAREGESILVADDPNDYVNHILELESNATLAKSISTNAVNYVKEQHSWSGKLAPFIDRIDLLF